MQNQQNCFEEPFKKNSSATLIYDKNYDANDETQRPVDFDMKIVENDEKAWG